MTLTSDEYKEDGGVARSMALVPAGGAGVLDAGGPVAFVRDVLGEQPYDKQAEMLSAVATNRRVSVVGCNGSGKDWAAARVVLWWLYAHSPAKAVVTGPTSRQVDEIVWNELRYAYARAADRLPGTVFRTSRYEIDESSFAVGFATNSPHNLLGFHSPNLLVVITEAHAVGEQYMDAVRRLNPTRILMTGNPFELSGAFYDSHHGKRAMYRTVQISAFDTPNVKTGRIVVPGMITREDIEDRKLEWGEDNENYIRGVLGRFVDSSETVVVPLSVATAAAARSLPPSGPIIVGCDVARYGGDRTVVVRRQGPVARIVWRVRNHDTVQIARYLKRLCDEGRVDHLVVDDTGIGGGVVDILRREGLRHTRLTAFMAGGSPQTKGYFINAGAEVWWRMRTAYMDGELDTDDDAALIGQVSGRTFFRDEKDRIHLQRKSNLPRSPDEADALAMTYAINRITSGMKIWT